MKKFYITPKMTSIEVTTTTPLLSCSSCSDPQNPNYQENGPLLFHGTFGFNFNPDDFNDKA